jgi:uridine phosphorylase
MADRLEPLAAGLSSPLVVSAGLCGSLDPGLPVGALVIPEVVLDTRGARSPTVDLPGCRREGTLVTVAEVLSTPEAKNGLRAATGALATDMESSTIVAAAATRGWPALVVRAVSDDARTSLPPALVRLVDDDGALRVGAAALTLIARPALLPRALALRRDQRLALRAAAAALELLVRPGPGRT